MNNAQTVRHTIRCVVNGYIWVGPIKERIDAVNTVMKGNQYISTNFGMTLSTLFFLEDHDLYHLSPKERIVLRKSATVIL